jgi:hypothetical protein
MTDCRTFERRVFDTTGEDVEYGELDRAAIIALNRAMRAQDQSDLWPISGRFNVTDRAIRRVTHSEHWREYRSEYGPLEYVLAVYDEIGNIVNDPATF